MIAVSFSSLFSSDKTEFSGKARSLSASAVREFGLTSRKSDISGLFLTGLNNREIDEKLFIARKTVDTHIYNIYRKCNVKTR